VLVSNAWVVVSAKRNQREASGGVLELTERELGLPPMMGDSTAVSLDLGWDTYSSTRDHRGPPDWLTADKLAELGIDCRLPLTSANARHHYSTQAPVPAFLVLEYEGEAWKAATNAAALKPDTASRTRLFVVDAARDPERLRQKYPDRGRWAIARGVVRPFFQDRNLRDGTPLPAPRLGGWIEVIPGQVFVPHPHSGVLQTLRGRDDQAERATDAEPRFAVTVAWGARAEPWVRAVRLLPTSGAGHKPGR
jgi:hypothetical protein